MSLIVCLGAMHDYRNKNQDLSRERKTCPTDFEGDQILAHLSHNNINAHKFEKPNRAHTSVSADSVYTVPEHTRNMPPGTLLKLEKQSVYTVPEHTRNMPPGTLLKLEKQTDTSLYTLPPKVFHFRITTNVPILDLKRLSGARLRMYASA